MPVCQACYSFVDADDDRCPSCGQARTAIADETLGLDLLESVEEQNPGLRPTMLLLPIAGIPLVFGLWRLALGQEGLARFFPGIFACSLVGGASVGGLAYMLLRQQRGYEPNESRAWWIAGLCNLVTPVAIGTARFLNPDGNVLAAAMLFGGAQLVLSLVGTAMHPIWKGGRHRGIPALGSVMCGAWVAAIVLLLVARAN